MELPAVRKGEPDVFDLAPKFDKPEKRAAWFDKQCAMIRKGCRRNHGVAHRHFIKRVIKKSRTVRAEIGPLRDSFVKKVSRARLIKLSDISQRTSATSTPPASSRLDLAQCHGRRSWC
jgi:hypothetical protein